MGRDPNFDNSLDFEVTDFDTARQALDELPAGVGAVQKSDPGYWRGRRRPPTVTDRALTGPTLDWLMTLPPVIRPQRTSDRYPRIVNRIAEAAPDRDALLRAIASFLDDQRPGRAGLPPPMRDELQRLARFLRVV